MLSSDEDIAKNEFLLAYRHKISNISDEGLGTAFRWRASAYEYGFRNIELTPATPPNNITFKTSNIYNYCFYNKKLFLKFRESLE